MVNIYPDKENNANILTNAMEKEPELLLNALGDLVDLQMGSPYNNMGNAPISQTDGIAYNNRYDFISNDRLTLNYFYATNGIFKRVIDVPVLDAFRSGVRVKTKELDGKQLKQLHSYMERNTIIDTLVKGIIWGRLFGGGGIVITVNNQDPKKPFKYDSIKKGDPIWFYAADMWELCDSNLNYSNPYLKQDVDVPYNLYGHDYHKSRVFRIIGDYAPSLIRPRFRGFGASKAEGLIRSVNQYNKICDVIFQLLDEAKLDIYGIKHFNASLATQTGTQAIQRRIQLANMLKNYHNGIAMDTEDTYSQKQLTFSGLAEMMQQAMVYLCAETGIHELKLFGISSSGFNSDETSLENYNAMVESEVRSKNKYTVIEVIGLICRSLFGFDPEDLDIEWQPMRLMTSEMEEKVKTEEFTRIMESWDRGLIDDKEAVKQINYKNLLPYHIESMPKIISKKQNPEDRIKNSLDIDWSLMKRKFMLLWRKIVNKIRKF